MTSLSTIGPEPQHLEGRTVRDIVEYSPEEVNEVWCRKIFRQILQSLELQYAMHMPHRPITPDTVVFHDNGEPLLLPTPGAPAEGSEAEDLNALARVVHYAITRELAPTGPLQGRVPEGYSDSLVAAVDRCMAPDPAQRPHGIEELRNLLGIVPLGPPIPPPPFLDDDAPAPGIATEKPGADPSSPPSFMQGAGKPRTNAGLGRWQRWAVAGGAGAVLLALALALFAEMRDTASFDHIVLTLPQQGEGGRREHAPAADQDRVADSGNPAPLAGTPGGADSGASPSAMLPADAPGPGTPALQTPATAPAQPGRLGGAPAVPKGGAAYKLRIQPWGIVYVDGVDRGVSPPVKRLVLAPGKHTIRVTNPNFHDRELEVDTAGGDGQIAVNFNDDAQ